MRTALFVLVLAGCGGAEVRGPSVSPETHDSPAVHVENATRVDYACSEDAVERCNGIDDDCDGHIDPECGFGEGAVEIAIAWRGAPDFDLVVTDAAGHEMRMATPDAIAGARLDHDGRGSCGEAEDEPRIEHARFEAAIAPLRVSVARGEECDAEPDALPVTLAIASRTIAPMVLNALVAPGETVLFATLR